MWVGEGLRWAGDVAGQWCSIDQLIWNTLRHNLSNALSEATKYAYPGSTKRAYGYHSPEALIAMAMLTRGGLYLGLPAGTTEPQTGSRPTGGPRPDWHHMISRARPSPAMSATARRQGEGPDPPPR